MATDFDGKLSTAHFLTRTISVGSGTGTVAGVDLKDFVGEMKLILTYAEVNGLNPLLIMGFKDSADNSTFAAITAPSFSSQTTTATNIATTTLDTRAVRRYLQASYVQTGTTTTTAVSVVGVGLKQLV